MVSCTVSEYGATLLLPGGFDLALTFEPAVTVFFVEGTEDDDVLQDDAIIYAIVSDSEAVERRCESRQSLDSRFGFLKWLNGQTGLDFFENEAGDRAWELGEIAFGVRSDLNRETARIGTHSDNRLITFSNGLPPRTLYALQRFSIIFRNFGSCSTT